MGVRFPSLARGKSSQRSWWKEGGPTGDRPFRWSYNAHIDLSASYFTSWRDGKRLVRSTGKTTQVKAEQEAERFVSELETSHEVPTLRAYDKDFYVWLKGTAPPRYRVKSGECRIIFSVAGTTITILEIVARKDAYRWSEVISGPVGIPAVPCRRGCKRDGMEIDCVYASNPRQRLSLARGAV